MTSLELVFKSQRCPEFFQNIRQEVHHQSDFFALAINNPGDRTKTGLYHYGSSNDVAINFEVSVLIRSTVMQTI